MSNLENANAGVPAASPPLRTWDFLETTFVVLIAEAVFIGMAQLGLTYILTMHGTKALSPAELGASWIEGRWQGAGVTVAALPTIAVLWIAVRMTGRGFAEYLALNWPTRREALRAFGMVAIIVVAESFIGYFVGVQEPAMNCDVIVRGPGGLFIL